MLVLLFAPAISSCEESTSEHEGKRLGGFRGIKWEQDIKTVEGMKFLYAEKNGRGKIYKRNDEVMQMGKAKLIYIHYFFWDDKLAVVEVYARWKSNAERILSELEETFGKPQKTKQSERETFCHWRFSDEDILYVLSGGVFNECYVYFEYRPLAKEMDNVLR
jgi:hypothetical protein